MKRTLLVEPDFPVPLKSKNHKNFLPIGLLKIATLLVKNGIRVKLVRGTLKNIETQMEIIDFNPDEVWITSLFTYWAEFVRDSVQFYKELFPNSKIVVGGIFASLLSKDEVRSYTGCDFVHQGIIPEAEEMIPAYDLLSNSNNSNNDYCIVHASRGCLRKCSFCGTWKIEPEFRSIRSIKKQITHKKVVFYDNNLLMNQYIEDILYELIDLKKENKIIWCESR